MMHPKDRLDDSHFVDSDKSHEEMLRKYLEYYNHWDEWHRRRSKRTYFNTQRTAKQLLRLVKKHNKTLARDFYRVKLPYLRK